MDILKRYLRPYELWLPITEEQARAELQPLYLRDTDDVMREIAGGQIVFAEVAKYKRADAPADLDDLRKWMAGLHPHPYEED